MNNIMVKIFCHDQWCTFAQIKITRGFINTIHKMLILVNNSLEEHNPDHLILTSSDMTWSRSLNSWLYRWYFLPICLFFYVVLTDSYLCSCLTWVLWSLPGLPSLTEVTAVHLHLYLHTFPYTIGPLDITHNTKIILLPCHSLSLLLLSLLSTCNFLSVTVPIMLQGLQGLRQSFSFTLFCTNRPLCTVLI